MNPIRCLLPVALLMLGACSAAPTHYYTLLRPQAQAQPQRTQAYAIDVQRVMIPAQLDQSEILVRQGQSEVALASREQWIAPLAQEMRSALLQRLKQRLGVAEVSQLAQPAGLKVYRVLLDVQGLDARLAHSVSLDAGWTVMENGSDAAALRLSCASSLTRPVAAGYPALVAGIQQSLEEVADQIAELIRKAQAGAALSCPSGAAS